MKVNVVEFGCGGVSRVNEELDRLNCVQVIVERNDSDEFLRHSILLKWSIVKLSRHCGRVTYKVKRR